MKQITWTQEEDSMLINNVDKPLKEISLILGRTIPSIKSRKNILKLTINDLWCKDEEKILKEKYSFLSKKELLKLFPNRKWGGIIAKAKTLKLTRMNYYHDSLKNHNLKILLENSLQTYYYIGLLMADGYFTNRGLVFSQSDKYMFVIENFGKYIECSNIKYYENIGQIEINGVKTFGNSKKVINAHDKNILPKILEKFNIVYEINKTKTYYPPNINIFENMSDELFLSYLIGFIDGDGCISKKIRNGNSIIITVHENWLNVIEYWKLRIEKIYGVKLSEKSITKTKTYYRFKIYKRNILLNMRHLINNNNLMVNHIKWGRI
jgi:hypothetical protein